MPDRPAPPASSPDRIAQAASKATHIGAPSPMEKLLDDPSGLIPAAGVLDEGAHVAQPFLRSLNKPLSELLDTIFRPTSPGSGLPQRLRLTNWDWRNGEVQYHNSTPGGARFESSPKELDKLIGSGALEIEQPGNRAVGQIRSKLANELDKSQVTGPKRR